MIKGNVNIVKKMWSDKATIIGTTKSKDSRGITKMVDTTIVSDEPCKVVKKTLNGGNQSFFDEVKYNSLLLISNGIKIPQGADINITDINGNVTNYRLASGGYAHYTTHQEVAMVLDDKA